MPKYVSIGLFCRPVVAKTPIFAVFWTSAFSDVHCWRQYPRKLNTGAQLQTFPYPTVSKSFLYSNAFMAKSGAQTVTFISVTNRETNRQNKQTDRQTNRQKTQRFCLPRRRVKSQPHPTWHGDRGPRARSCTYKTFGGLMYSFTARGR